MSDPVDPAGGAVDGRGEGTAGPLPPDHPDRAFSPEATAQQRAATLPTGDGPSGGTPPGSTPAGTAGDPPSPSESLGPADRVIPSWTDPTVRRASALVGGPLGRHALVGRNSLITPLRVCLLMAIAVLAMGWLVKSPCIQAKGDPPALDQSGERPWITGCYNDVVPLFGSRGFNRPHDFPYANSFIELDDGGERRIYPPAGITQNADGVTYTGPEGTTALSDKDIVGDPQDGYQQVQDGRLIPVRDIDQLGQVRYLEYPVLTGLFQWGISWLNLGYENLATSTGIVPVPLDVASYFTIGAIVLGLFWLWAVASTARMARRRVWDTAIMCLSPLLVVHAFTNWDLVAVGITAAGMLAWSRSRPVLAGVLLGLGMAAKLYPVLLLGPLLVLCLRSGRMRAWWTAAAGAAVAWLVVNVPVMLTHFDAWYEFIRLNSTRPPEFDSWYFLFAHITGSTVWNAAEGSDTPSFLNAFSLLLFVLACLAIGWLALSAQRRPRFAQLAFLVVVAFLLTNKVWSPQYSIWLVPLVALALPRWRPVLVWQLSEAVVWYLLMLQFAGPGNKGLSVEPFVAAAIVRGGLVIMLVVMVVRDILRPERDPVRRAGDDDPTGGVLADRPDVRVLPSLPALVRRLGERRREPSTAAPQLSVVSAPATAPSPDRHGTPDGPAAAG